MLPNSKPQRALSLTCKARKNPKNSISPVQEKENNINVDVGTALLGSAGLLTPILLDVQTALAQKGEYGIVEGRIASLTHPVLMGFLFCSSLYTGWLGFQWRYVVYTALQLLEAPGSCSF